MLLQEMTDDLSEYIAALETFKNEHAEEVIKYCGVWKNSMR